MGFLSDAKDRMIEAMAAPILNRSLFAPYGQAREIRLNSTDKIVDIVFDLKGETDPVRVTLDGYEFTNIGDETFVTIHSMKTSREWLTAAVERNVVGRPVKLPSEFAGVLAKLV